MGFMAAGKTTVGRILAQRLGWRFIDFDEEIVQRSGMDVATLFRTRGEMAFRELELRLTAELSSVDTTVLAPGGGWILNPGARERLPANAVLVWLRVSPEEALRRAGESGVERPLLASDDPLGTARALLADREPHYATADLIIDVDALAPEGIVNMILDQFESESDGTE
ncbi:MAG: shikimate kinase [Longimicrobiales bacterium]